MEQNAILFNKKKHLWIPPMSGFNYQGGDSSKAKFYILRLLSLQNVLPLHTDLIALDHTN